MLGPLRRLVYRHWQKFHGVRRRELAVLSGYLDPRPGDRILDLGSGKGAYCGTLARKGSRPTGVDPSLSALSIAHTWVDGAGRFVGASGESLPLQDGAFDKAVSVCVLEHTSDPARVLSELARVTRPGGTLAISVDAMNSPHVTEEHRRHHAAEYKCNRFFDEKELRALLSSAGFETIETRYLFGGKLSVALSLSRALRARVPADLSAVAGGRSSPGPARERDDAGGEGAEARLRLRPRRRDHGGLRYASTSAIAAGSPCVQRMERFAVAAPTIPATSTQKRKKIRIALPAGPSHSPQTMPAARKRL
jgi:SAM-dependent methyltransferase